MADRAATFTPPQVRFQATFARRPNRLRDSVPPACPASLLPHRERGARLMRCHCSRRSGVVQGHAEPEGGGAGYRSRPAIGFHVEDPTPIPLVFVFREPRNQTAPRRGPP